MASVFRHNRGMENETAQVLLRRTHLGPRYDIYTQGAYRATAYTAKELTNLLEKLNLQ